MLKRRFILGCIAACLMIGGLITMTQKPKSDKLSQTLIENTKVDTTFSAYEQALLLVKNNQASAAVVKDNKILAQELGKGILPILNLHDNQAAALDGGSLIDKVIGRAAAFIAIDGKVRSVYGEIMSEDALLLLQRYNIPATYKNLVPQILNRDKSGLCPMEQTVLDVQSSQEAVKRLRQKLKDLNLSK